MRYVLAPLCASNDIRDDTRGNLGREEKDGTHRDRALRIPSSASSAVDMGHTVGSVYTDRGNVS